MYIKIIGVGSPFGADNLAQKAIARLQCLLDANKTINHRVESLYLDRPGVNLLAHFTGVDYLIIIDAALTVTHAGEILEVELHDLEQPQRLFFSGHSIGVVSAIALAQTLEALPPCVKLYGIGIDDLMVSGHQLVMVNEFVDRLYANLIEV